MSLSFIHFNIFATTTQTYKMIIFNHIKNKEEFDNLIFS